MAPVGWCVPRLHTFCTPEQRARTTLSTGYVRRTVRTTPDPLFLRRHHCHRRRGYGIAHGGKGREHDEKEERERKNDEEGIKPNLQKR